MVPPVVVVTGPGCPQCWRSRALGRLPERLTVLAVVGRDFGFGAGLTAEVAAAVAELVEQVRCIVRQPGRGKGMGVRVTPGPFGEKGF